MFGGFADIRLFGRKVLAIAGAGFAKNLRHDQFEKVQGYSFTNIDRFSTGSIITRLTLIVTNLQNAYSMIIRMGVRAPIMVNCGVDLLLPHQPIHFAGVPRLHSGARHRPVRSGSTGCIRCSSACSHTYDKLNNVVDENLQGIRVVKSYNRENHETEKFNRISERIFKDFTKAERIMSFNNPLMMLCVYVSMLLIAWMGAQQIVASGNNAALGLTTGDLTALVTYAMQNSHGHDDAVHDFRDVHYFAGLRRTHLPGAERGKHGYESGKSGYGSEEW